MYIYILQLLFVYIHFTATFCSWFILNFRKIQIVHYHFSSEEPLYEPSYPERHLCMSKASRLMDQSFENDILCKNGMYKVKRGNIILVTNIVGFETKKNWNYDFNLDQQRV